MFLAIAEKWRIRNLNLRSAVKFNQYYYLKDCQLSRKFGSIKAFHLPLLTYKLRFLCHSSYNFTSPLPAHCVFNYCITKYWCVWFIVKIFFILVGFFSEQNYNLSSVFLMLLSKMMCS